MALGAGAAENVSVLVVDDDYDIRASICDILQDEGYSVAMACHGAEAMEMLKRIKPSLILLDLNMPIMNGADFRAAQKLDPALSAIPTVVMTAVDRMKERLADMAPNAALAKPLKLESLLAVVAQFCDPRDTAAG